jgi:hypothetical protein
MAMPTATTPPKFLCGLASCQEAGLLRVTLRCCTSDHHTEARVAESLKRTLKHAPTGSRNVAARDPVGRLRTADAAGAAPTALAGSQSNSSDIEEHRQHNDRLPTPSDGTKSLQNGFAGHRSGGRSDAPGVCVNSSIHSFAPERSPIVRPNEPAVSYEP